MKTIPAGMQTDLDGGATTHCFCWKLTRSDAVVMGFTNHDRNLSFDAVTFESETGFEPSAVDQSTGFNVDNTETVGALSSVKITEEDIAKGLYDNAKVEIYQVDWTDVTKRVLVFSGIVGEVVRGSLSFKGEVRSQMLFLNQPQGRTYMKTCDADLFDARCALLVGSHPDFLRTGSVATVLSDRLVLVSTAEIAALPAGWFTGGLLTWTSGNNNGQRMEVMNHLKQGSQAFIELWELMSRPVQVGDTFTIRVGCDKTIETCKAKFNNVLNFRGFPRMPTNDVVMQVASKDGQHNGGSWFT